MKEMNGKLIIKMRFLNMEMNWKKAYNNILHAMHVNLWDSNQANQSMNYLNNLRQL